MSFPKYSRNPVVTPNISNIWFFGSLSWLWKLSSCNLTNSEWVLWQFKYIGLLLFLSIFILATTNSQTTCIGWVNPELLKYCNKMVKQRFHESIPNFIFDFGNLILSQKIIAQKPKSKMRIETFKSGWMITIDRIFVCEA